MDFLNRLLARSIEFPSTIALLGDDTQDDNAAASSSFSSLEGYTELGAQLLFGSEPTGYLEGNEQTKAAAFITIDLTTGDDGQWYAGAMHTLPANGSTSDLSSTFTHEMFHALGMIASINADEDESNPGIIQYVLTKTMNFCGSVVCGMFRTTPLMPA